jgi:Xaa-Pro aminopeptidase
VPPLPSYAKRLPRESVCCSGASCLPQRPSEPGFATPEGHGAPAPPDVIVASARREVSGCWADMTRTFVVGEVSEAVRAQEALVGQALESVRAAVHLAP